MVSMIKADIGELLKFMKTSFMASHKECFMVFSNFSCLPQGAL